MDRQQGIQPDVSGMGYTQIPSQESFLPPDNLLFPNDFNDFSNFIDTMGLHAGLDFLYDPALNFQDMASTQNEVYTVANEPVQIPSLPIDNATTIHAASTQTRIRPMEDDFEELGPVPCPWKIHEEERSQILGALSPFHHLLIGFALPSRLALGRYITGYFEHYQDHLPILHPVTFRPPQYYQFPALFLAMAAIGAIYRCETRTAMELFRASKQIVLETWQDGEDSLLDEGTDMHNAIKQLRTVQAALLLDKFAVCQCDSQSAKDTLTLQSLLAAYLRSSSPLAKSSSKTNCKNWHDWVIHESYRRTQLGIFFVLNLHTVFFDKPPIALTSQLDVDLPCPTAEWIAPSQSAWDNARIHTPESVNFQDAFSALFSESPADKHLNYSPFANLVLIHALLQRIYLARQMQPNPSGSLREADMYEMGLALKQWTAIWKQAPESILDPLNHDGSNSLTSTAILGLARIRLHSNYSFPMRAGNRDWQKVAKRLFDTAPPLRTENMTLPLLHSAHALNFLVKFGIMYISRTMFGWWDNQNLFYYLEAAVFLSKWLETMAETYQAMRPTEAELKIIGIVVRVIEELAASLDAPESLGHLYTLGDLDHGNVPLILRSLSSQIVRGWAVVFDNSRAPWAIVGFIGRSLDLYAQMAEERRLSKENASLV
ncbi:hypothetical protein D6D02_07976 [Aureobasidium pullulans]|nr:hypothetical protein D6D02_07976 [Aureobasidium pullulans]